MRIRTKAVKYNAFVGRNRAPRKFADGPHDANTTATDTKQAPVAAQQHDHGPSHHALAAAVLLFYSDSRCADVFIAQSNFERAVLGCINEKIPSTAYNVFHIRFFLQKIVSKY